MNIQITEEVIEVRNKLLDIAICIEEAAGNYKKAMDSFVDSSDGYIGDAQDNTSLLSEKLYGQLLKLASFYNLASRYADYTYEKFTAEDIEISNRIEKGCMERDR